MHPALIYLFKVSLALGIFTCVYQLAFRRLTFYTANRVFLLAVPLAAFLIPLIGSYSIPAHSPGNESLLIRWVPNAAQIAGRYLTAESEAPDAPSSMTLADWTAVAWLAGMLFLALRAILSLLSLASLRSASTRMDVQGISVAMVQRPIVPFSFFNRIFLPADRVTEPEASRIIAHELVHVHQLHSFDILLAETVCMLHWFNPLSWLYRHSVRENLEFIADDRAAGAGEQRHSYQLLLLEMLGHRTNVLSSPFNFSNIKTRIIMMNKRRTRNGQFIRFAFIVPVIALLLLSFRRLTEPNASLLYKAVVMDVHSRKPVAGMKVKDQETGQESVTDREGMVELRFTGTKSIELKLLYTAAGYINQTSNFSLSMETELPGKVLVVDLVGVSQGEAMEQCTGCFNSITIGDDQLLKDPRKALDDYLANRLPGNQVAIADSTGTGMRGETGRAEVRIRTNEQQGAARSVLPAKPQRTGPDPLLTPAKPSADPVYVIDGKIISYDAIKAISDSTSKHYLDPSDIESITVLKDAVAADKYGKNAVHGVILIETKKGKK